MPLWLPQVEVKPAPVAVEMPSFVETGLRVTYEGERGWTMPEEETARFEEGRDAMKLWQLRVPAVALRSAKMAVAPANALRWEFLDLYKCLAMEVALNSYDEPEPVPSASPSTSRASISDYFAELQSREVQVGLVRVPRERRGLDDGRISASCPSDLDYYSLPTTSPVSQRTQMLIIATVAATVAVTTATATIASFFNKLW